MRSMSATEHALLRGVLENPDDDAPRLVYADWLEERGDPRAEFIRVQCELAGLDPYSPRRTQLESRELQLLRRHSKGWAGPLRKYAKRWWFRRGFLERVEMPAATFLERSRELFEQFPVRGAWLTHAWKHLEDLSARDELLRLSEFGLPGCSRLVLRGTSPLGRFLNSARLELLESLALPECFISNTLTGDEGAAFVAGLPALAGLRSLDLRTNGLGPAGIEHLANSPHLKNVRHLQLASCRNISPMYEEADLAGPLPRALSPLLDRLESLDLTRCCITRAGVRELTSASTAEQLRHLVLDGNQLYDMEWGVDYPSFGEVLDSLIFQRLITLDLSSCYLDEGNLSRLVKREQAAAICYLSLNNSFVGPAGARAVVDSANLRNLTHLNFNGAATRSAPPEQTRILDRGIAALAQSEDLLRLAALSLRRNGITAAGIRELLASPILQQLYRIDLSQNEIGDEGADLLAAHGPWPMLAYLNVRHNGLSKHARDTLRETFGYRVLV